MTRIEDVGKFVDGVIRFYDRYPVEGIKRLLGKDWHEVEKMISYSPVVKGIHYEITPYIEHIHILTALRRFFNKELLNIN